jgi:hypothetical protein
MVLGEIDRRRPPCAAQPLSRSRSAARPALTLTGSRWRRQRRHAPEPSGSPVTAAGRGRPRHQNGPRERWSTPRRSRSCSEPAGGGWRCSACKAIRPAGTFTVNAGGAAILPSFLGDALWRSPTFGAACDTVDTILLLAALGRVRRLTNTWQRTAATAILAGLLSNLVDRLGGSAVFHAGLPRGSIDWIPVPAWPTARANIADVIIALGVLALIYHPARHALLAVHNLTRRSRAAQLGAATAGLIAVAIWTTLWQANRNTMEHRPTTQSDTFAQCTTSYPSDGMDWVSYRPTAGPLTYHPPSSQQTDPGCAKTTPTEIPQCARARARFRLPDATAGVPPVTRPVWDRAATERSEARPARPAWGRVHRRWPRAVLLTFGRTAGGQHPAGPMTVSLVNGTAARTAVRCGSHAPPLRR